MKNLGIITATILIIAFNAVFSGAVFVHLWRWFAVSIFEVPSLTIAEAIGLILLFQFCLITPHPTDDSTEKWAEKLGRSFCRSLSSGVTAPLFGKIASMFL